jgi:transposase
MPSKNGLSSHVADIVREHPGAEVQVWAEDEARFGLMPTSRRVWAPKGQRPTASSKRSHKWAYLFSFVRPSTGETVNFVGSTVSAAIMSGMLECFAKEAGLDAMRRAVVVLDGAGWHTAGDLRVPEGVHLVRLPAYSPELQPAERVWPIINEAIANREFADLPELMATIDARCYHLDENRDYVSRVTNFHWWPGYEAQGVPPPVR